MSKFECPIVRIREVQDHPNADRLNLNFIEGFDFICISNKTESGDARYKPGDRIVYMPEASVLPDLLLQKLGFWKDDKGTLNGAAGNRIKAMRLRGTLSQGVIMSLREAVGDLADSFPDGFDLAEEMGIEKYEPPIPVHMAGQVCNIFGQTMAYDIENLKKYPDVIAPDDLVQVVEKCHGTQVQIGYIPGLNHPDLPGDWYVASKGMGSQGLVFKNNAENEGNLYLRTIKALGIIEKIRLLGSETQVYLLGEIFGLGVQDLTYGEKKPTFAAFDIYFGAPGLGKWVDANAKREMLSKLGIQMLPVLYDGPFNRQKMDELASGMTVIGGDNIREGIVITPLVERRDQNIGRVILKNISPEYLLRKGNTTEFD